MESSENQVKKTAPGCKAIANKSLLILAIFISPFVFLILCCVLTGFPPQIFGNNQDHFRAHVINPIPESVEILDVAFDDLIIHPDVTYYFRFLVNREDLEKIIAYRSLETTDGTCSGSSYPPQWWDVASMDDVEKYGYESPGGLILTLCYHVPSQTAYYMFLTY